MNALSARLAGFAAILFVIAMVAGVFVGFNSPDTNASDQEWLDYVRSGGDLWATIIGAYLLVIAGILFIVFVVAMYQRLRSDGADAGWSMVMLTTGLGWSFCMMIGVLISATVAGTIKFGDGPEPAAETVRWISQIGFGVMLVAGGLCAAASTAIMATLILKTKILPAWLAYFGYLGALAMVVAAFFIPMIIFALWMLAMGITLAMRPSSVGTMPAEAAA
jgi:hypothetical protein